VIKKTLICVPYAIYPENETEQKEFERFCDDVYEEYIFNKDALEEYRSDVEYSG